MYRTLIQPTQLEGQGEAGSSRHNTNPLPAVRSAQPPVLIFLLACNGSVQEGERGHPAPEGVPTRGIPAILWHDASAALLPPTAEWTNKVELADLDGDGRVDLLFANGGNYSEPGDPEPNRAFLNRAGPAGPSRSGARRSSAPRPTSPA